MANFTVTPNMSLILPIPGEDPGPDYGNNQYSSGLILDGHNHSPGSGVQINPNGLDINADLPINGNNLTFVKTVNFQAQLAPLAGSAPNLGCIYVAGNELYYNDEVGNVVPITKTGSVNAGAGSITGLPSGTASASYNSGSQTFVWQSATSTPANLDAGSVIIRDITASSNGVTISAPSALAANYTLTLPAGLPATKSLLSLDTSGNIAAFPTSNPANNSNVTVSSSGVLALTPQAAGYVVSSSSGNFTTSSSIPVTNMSVTITTIKGNPVKVGFTPAPYSAGQYGEISVQSSSPPADTLFQVFNASSTQIFGMELSTDAFGSTTTQLIVGPSVLDFVDFTVVGTPGTYTYTLQVAPQTGSVSVKYVLMYAYEMS